MGQITRFRDISPSEIFEMKCRSRSVISRLVINIHHYTDVICGRITYIVLVQTLNHAQSMLLATLGMQCVESKNQLN